MVGSNLVYFERQEEPRIRVATLICNLTRTFLVFKLETFSKIRSIQPVISTTHALIVAVHFFVVNSGPQYMQRPRDQGRHKTTSYLLFFYRDRTANKARAPENRSSAGKAVTRRVNCLVA